ncbi:MAG: Uncharacterised protein [Rhodothermaeota bacterium MED-G12]|nr:MAG: Uncharacterised protein [Rhodothermaeota bacterium MED-G12]
MAREQARIDSIRVAEQAALEARMQAVEDSLAAVEAVRLAEETAKTTSTFDENGSYVIQTGAWRSEVKANAQAAQWASEGVSAAYVVQTGDETTGDVWFRVRLGYFPSMQDAQNFGTEMGLSYWVTTRN